MLRNAVITRIIGTVLPLSGRVYQAYLAPSTVQKPYATVKAGAIRGSPGLNYAGTVAVEVYIYTDQTSYIGLDAIEKEVVAALHGKEIVDVESMRYFLQWESSPGDFVDEEKRLIGRQVVFGAAILYEPGGGGA